MMVRYIVLLVSLISITGFGQGYYIKDFHVDVRLDTVGYAHVEENITVDFETQKRGIIRHIPYRFKLDTLEYTTKISDIKVPNYKKKVESQNGEISIRIGDKDVFLTGEQQYRILYKVKKPFLFHKEFTEFYWNLTGNEWDTRIDKASFSISMDKNIQLSPADIKGFSGAFGATDTLDYLQLEGNVIRGMKTGLNAQEGITAAVKLPADFIPPPPPPTAMEIWMEKYGKNLLALLYLLLFSGIFYRMWKKHGKDDDVTLAARFMPPEELNPAECGVIVDEKVNNIDVVSLIPYWAQHGYLKIKHIPVKWAKDDYELQKINEISDSAQQYEKNLFYHLFDSGNTVLLSSLQENFYTHMNNAKEGLRGRIKALDVYYSKSDNMQILAAVLTFFVFIGGMAGGIFMGNLPMVAGAIIASVAGLVATIYMRKKTQRGVELFQEVIGFREFVKTADKPRIERLLKEDPMYFEKTLPYAMVFGYAKKWGDKFDGLMTEPPTWYIGSGPYIHGHMFNSGDFARDFEGGMREVQSAFTSMPASQGGGSFGGSGGGGFSGGGFGGGGGSSW
jgi:uncharacterized membrane protein YgcG